jgi:hypothetical protein
MKVGFLLGGWACAAFASGPVEWYGPSDGVRPRTSGSVPQFTRAFEIPGKGYVAFEKNGNWGVGVDRDGNLLWKQDLTGPTRLSDPRYIMDTALALGAGFAGIRYAGEADLTTLLRYNAGGILQDRIPLGRPIAYVDGGYLAIRDSASDTGSIIRRPVVAYLDSNGSVISRSGLMAPPGSSVRAFFPMGPSWSAVSWVRGASEDSVLLQEVSGKGVPGSGVQVPLGGKVLPPDAYPFRSPIRVLPYRDDQERLFGFILENPAPMDPNQVLSADSLILFRIGRDGKILARAGSPLARSTGASVGHQGTYTPYVYQAHEIEGFELRPDGRLRVRLHDWSRDSRVDRGPYPASHYLELLWSPGAPGILPAGSEAETDLATSCGSLPAVPDGRGNQVAWSDCKGNAPFLFVRSPNGRLTEWEVPGVVGPLAYFLPTRDGGALVGGSLSQGDAFFPMIKLAPGYESVALHAPLRGPHSGSLKRGSRFDALGRPEFPARSGYGPKLAYLGGPARP